MNNKNEGDINGRTAWQHAQRRLEEAVAVGRSDDLRMVLQQAAAEEVNMGGEEKVVQEAGHPGWDASR